jgi:Domain of unknown function (DUF5047)
MSEAMQTALQGSHTVATLVQVLGPDGTLLGEIPDAVGGSVTVERAAIERRADVGFVDVTGTLSPVTATGSLAPYANSLRLWRGVRFADDSTELVPLITARIARNTGRYPSISATLYDYAWVVGRARLEAPYTIAAGTNYIDALAALLVDRFPAIVTNFPTTAQTTPLIVLDEQADPWAEAQRMAESLGMRLFFDGLGVCRLVDESEASTEAVWSYQEGPRSTIVDLDRDLDTEANYNAVVVVGESAELTAPVRAVTYDLDSTSPTQYGGPYGKVARFYASEFITTTDQAQAAANAMLLKELGMTEQLAISGVVNPAHEVGDVLAVRRLASGVDSNHVLDNVTIPLKGAVASIRTRARQVLAA